MSRKQADFKIVHFRTSLSAVILHICRSGFLKALLSEEQGQFGQGYLCTKQSSHSREELKAKPGNLQNQTDFSLWFSRLDLSRSIGETLTQCLIYCVFLGSCVKAP